MKKFDITILTASKYIKPENVDWYIQQVLDEDQFVQEALENKGLKVSRTNWDNPDFDWSDTDYILFRTIWDYFDRFGEFEDWIRKVNEQTQLINPMSTIQWNMDKHYLGDLQGKGVHIPPTLFIETGDSRTLAEIVHNSNWHEIILKPAVSGAGRHTYRFTKNNTHKFESIFQELIKKESMLLQEYQHNITRKGEIALMLFGGNFSHAVLKKAKAGDFRVQDDFGGTVHDYFPNEEEIAIAEQIVATCNPLPVYSRVDLIWDNNDKLCVSELELIEPELWFRKYLPAADLFAEKIIDFIDKKNS